MNMQEMEKRLAAGPVEHCSEMRACGTFVCEYERLYHDDTVVSVAAQQT